jgi:predicted DsbA family dithiol-disulfide isomerase
MPAPEYVRRAAASEAGARLRQMAAAAGREIVLNTEWTPNSRRALEASEYAREQGRHEAFHRAVFHRFYGQGKDLEEWQVLRDAASEVGLDPDALQAAAEGGRYRRVVDEHIRNAHSLGISGVPAYILGDRYLIMGAQPYDVFRQVMAELGATPHQAA